MKQEEFIKDLRELLEKYHVHLFGDDEYGHNEVYLGKSWFLTTLTQETAPEDTIYIDLEDLQKELL